MIQVEHGFHNNNFWWASSPLYFQVCMTVGREAAGGPCWAMVNGAEPTLLKFLPWLAESDGRLRDRANWATTLNHKAWEGFFPVSKLCGLPAHLPRNLASFSPRVDDRNGGGSGPRRLRHHRCFLASRRGGVRVLIVHFNSRGQRSYWRTCGGKYSCMSS